MIIILRAQFGSIHFNKGLFNFALSNPMSPSRKKTYVNNDLCKETAEKTQITRLLPVFALYNAN